MRAIAESWLFLILDGQPGWPLGNVVDLTSSHDVVKSGPRSRKEGFAALLHRVDLRPPRLFVTFRPGACRVYYLFILSFSSCSFFSLKRKKELMYDRLSVSEPGDEGVKWWVKEQDNVQFNETSSLKRLVAALLYLPTYLPAYLGTQHRGTSGTYLPTKWQWGLT